MINTLCRCLADLGCCSLKCFLCSSLVACVNSGINLLGNGLYLGTDCLVAISLCSSNFDTLLCGFDISQFDYTSEYS